MAKRRLVIEERWYDQLNRLYVYVILCIIMILLGMISYNEKPINLTDIFVVSVIFLFLLYVFYRNATEKHLFKTKTPLNKEEIRERLLAYAEKRDFEVYRQSNDYLILNEDHSTWGPRYKKTRIFFIQDNQLLFTVIRDNFRVNLPTLTTHLFMKYDMAKLLRQTQTNVQNI